ncbi:uroporphyrinogen-III synthase, partial [bacterium]|nr:uroporphyrinogen-III synthase [bacterium]
KNKIKKNRIFIPRAAKARDKLVLSLKSMGNLVKEVKIYDTVLPKKEDKVEIQNKIYSEKIDFITFTSSSTVENFFKYVSPIQIKKKKEISYVCIGPITASTLRAYKIKPSLVCSKYTIDNLIKEIVKFNKK